MYHTDTYRRSTRPTGGPEEWAELPRYPGYRFGSRGSLQSRWRPGPSRWRPYWRDLSPRTINGYRIANLRIGPHERAQYPLGALVLEAFHGPAPGPEHVCRHLDGDRLNCRVENLCWGTGDDVAADRERRGRTARGEAHYRWSGGAAAAV